MPRAHDSYNVALGQLSPRQKTGGRPGGHGARGLWQHSASPFQYQFEFEVLVTYSTENDKKSLKHTT